MKDCLPEADTGERIFAYSKHMKRLLMNEYKYDPHTVGDFFGRKLHFLWWQFNSIANTKYNSAATDKSSRQVDTRQDPVAKVQSFQQADTRQL